MPEGGRGRAPRVLWRRLARGLAALVYRDIDVRVPRDVARGGPVLAVANHFGGLADGVLLVDGLPRMPRIVARDLIWRVPGLGWLATSAGMIPIHRAADGAGTSNALAFASAYDALRDGEVLLIFPEGVTQDVPFMATVRTGAARIALGARSSGVEGIRILPIGIHYEDKAGFRSRALVNVGDPMALDEWAAARSGGAEGGAEDRAAVVDLTADIGARLRRAAPDFPDWSTAQACEVVAEVVLNDVDAASHAAQRYGDRALLAGRMNRLAEPARSAVIEAGHQYGDALKRAHASDRAVVAEGSVRPGTWLPHALLVAVLLPYALLGLLIAAVPLLLVLLVSKAPIAPAMRATAVPGVALLAFLTEWVLVAWQTTALVGWELGLASIVVFPFLLAVMFYVAERAGVLWRRWRSRPRRDSPQMAHLRELRALTSDAAWRAL